MSDYAWKGEVTHLLPFPERRTPFALSDSLLNTAIATSYRQIDETMFINGFESDTRFHSAYR